MSGTENTLVSRVARDAASAADIAQTVGDLRDVADKFSLRIAGRPDLDALYDGIRALRADPTSEFAAMTEGQIHTAVTETLKRAHSGPSMAQDMAGVLTPEAVLKAHHDLGEVKTSAAANIKATMRAIKRELPPSPKPTSWLSQNFSGIGKEQAISGGLSYLVAGMSALSAISCFRNGVKRDGETGERHIQPTSIGLGIIMALFAAGSAYVGTSTLRGPAR